MGEISVALAGNPNVGKSTIFNALTGMHQHTGNWSGKTVDLAVGNYSDNSGVVNLVDLPGTYSLFGLSLEEKIAGEYVESRVADVTVVVCDAAALERNLILALQVLSVTGDVVLCVNLLDEAEKHGIHVDLNCLSESLKVNVVGTAAGRGQGLQQLMAAIRNTAGGGRGAVFDLSGDDVAKKAREIAAECTTRTENKVRRGSFKLDKYVLGKFTGIPLMVLTLFVVLWLTVKGANIPSEILSAALFKFGAVLRGLLLQIGVNVHVVGALIDGIYNTTAWVVGVMLPPMVIFFPLFTILEDLGYLPRVAFNLDGPFKCCGSCGKQSLTMC